MVRQLVSVSVALCAKAQSTKSTNKQFSHVCKDPICELFDPPQGDNFFLERCLQQQGFPVVAGLDEVGRGPLAGPVVAAAVILPGSCDHSIFIDSKKLSAKKRTILFEHLHEINAHIGIGMVSHTIIDKINILQASLLAMKRGVQHLKRQGIKPDFMLIDGKFTIHMRIKQQALIKGETRSASIAAASIIAKVTRDRLMEKLHHKYPYYNFIKNQGYPTKEHRAAIATHGICPQHRLTFRGVKEFV